jgi:hypothetical protein
MQHLTLDELAEFFDQNPGATHAAAAAHFDVSVGTVSTRLARAGISRKLTLTERDVDVYDFVRDFIVDNGWPPSVTEVSNGVGCSGSAAHNSLHRLVAYGVIEMGDGARTIRVVGSKIDMKGAKNVSG